MSTRSGHSHGGFQLGDSQSFYRSTDGRPPTSPTAVPVVTEPSRSDGYEFEHLPEPDAVSPERAQVASLNYMDFCIQKIKFYKFYTYIHHKIHNRPIFMLKLNL